MFWCTDQEERAQTLHLRPCLTVSGGENHLPSNVALSPSDNRPFPCAGAAAVNDNVWPKREGISPLLRINNNESSLHHCSGLQTSFGGVRVPAQKGPRALRSQPDHPWRRSSSVLTHLPARDKSACQMSQLRSQGSPWTWTHQSIPAVQPRERILPLSCWPDPDPDTESPLGVKMHSNALLGTGSPPDHGSHTPRAGWLVCWRINKHKR